MLKDFSFKQVAAIVLSLLLPTLLIFAGYYFWHQPLKGKIEQIREETKNEERLISVIQQKKDQAEKIYTENTTNLQEKVPVASQVDQFLLDLHKAEELSDSLILSYGISEQDETIKEDPKPKKLEIENPFDETKESESASQGNQSTPLPQGMKRLTVNLSVISSNYTQLEQFLTEIEKLQRITNIDSLSFTGNPEVMMPTVQKPEIHYKVQVSTFYAPLLKDLVKDLPFIPYTEPANRKNPLSWNEVSNEP
ncbi:type 4a pilus biogenesis protein PilO [Ammoniphilus resinae]|uniref:Type IV pilus assembly protein PilO n=1 Tax=Ammoniphilus resinae TaxID=861532 RepID=A0ABS4GIZ1_9BACL|nr:hypothetical protein [Ammoniphilus resinae]MBP1930227.1 type IV pilus assembly protein PilO [Ammoniphilus resinae]